MTDISDEWIYVEKQVQDLVIEMAKITYKDGLVFNPQAMSRITQSIAEELFEPTRKYYDAGSH